jgi:hypothetical protein
MQPYVGSRVEMHGLGGGRAEDPSQIGFSKLTKKKEEFPRFMKTCRLGTPFPRSALFL